MFSQRLLNLQDCCEAQQLMLARPAGIVHVLITLLVALAATAVSWAALTEASVVVRARGRIRPSVRESITAESAAEETLISVPVSGQVAAVFVRDGQHVRAGMPFIQLDRGKLDNRLAQQLRRVKAAQMSLASLTHRKAAGCRRFEAATAKAQAELVLVEQEIEQRKKQLESVARVQQLELDIAADELARLQSLAQGQAVSALEIVRAQGRCQQIRVRLQDAQQPPAGGEWEVKRQALKLIDQEFAATQVELQAERSAKQAELEIADLELADIRRQYEQTTVTAPSDGIVTRVDVQVGDVVAAGHHVLSLVAQPGFRFDAVVTSRDVSHLRIGMPARIKLDIDDEKEQPTINGRVLYISPDSEVPPDSSGSAAGYHVKVSLDSQPEDEAQTGRVRLGMTGQVEVITGRRTVLSLLLQPIRQSIALN